MKDLEKDIISWQNKTFPDANIDGFREKLMDEIIELLEATPSGDKSRICDEAADVVIVLTGFLSTGFGASLTDEITKKMDINKLRKWENGNHKTA